MVEREKVLKSIENINSTNRYRENLSILKWIIVEDNFDKLLKSYWDEKKENIALLSWFLSKTNVDLMQLWNIKIDIKDIEKYIWNKPDLSKDLEVKIARLFLKKLYDTWSSDESFMDQIKSAFDIENEADIENLNIDFKGIRVNTQKISDNRNYKINSVDISNEEIFDLLGDEIDKSKDFNSQNLNVQWIVLDILQFEVKWIIEYAKSWWERAESDMEKFLLPSNYKSGIFDKVKDSVISQLEYEKSKLQDQLSSSYGKEKQELEKQIENLNKRIWEKYIENIEKSWEKTELVKILRKLCLNNFDFSKLDKKEQTILWQNLIIDKFDEKENSWAKYIWLDQNSFRDFLRDLYDFEKNETKIDIDGVWTLNLKIEKSTVRRKDSKWNEYNTYENFVDVDRFKDMDAVTPLRFTVNIDNNDENIIKNLEETKDSPLRANWIMETHITKWWELNIWNGYKLEICGKIITKSQLDELLNCDYHEDILNEKLKKLWLYDWLKDIEASVKKQMFDPQNIYGNLDENWFDDDSGSDLWYWEYWYRFCIFKEMLKKIDVNVVERNLIFEWNDIDRISQLYIMTKLWSKGLQQDAQADTWLRWWEEKKLTDAAKVSEEELGDAAEGERNAEDIRNNYIKPWYESEHDDSWTSGSGDGIDLYPDTENKISEYWAWLSETWKEAFEHKLEDLCNNGSDIEDDDKTTVWETIDGYLSHLKNNRPSAPIDIPQRPRNPEKTPEEEWREAWDCLDWDQDVWKKDAEWKRNIPIWTRLYFDLWETQLPPKDNNSDASKSFYCFEIVDIDDENFTLRAIWWDLKSDLVGNEYTLDRTWKQLDSMRKLWKIYKVRPSEGKRDWTSCFESINKAWFFKKITTFGNMESQVIMKDNKFVNNDWEEIKYFSSVESGFDGKTWKQWDKIYKYEIKGIDKTKGTVKIASRFGWYDENYKDVTYNYENEIPFEQFILLMEWKRLKWYTEAQQKKFETKYTIDDPGRLATKWLRKRISIKSIMNVFSNTKKAITTKYDERVKDQEEFLENYVFSHEWLDLYWKMRRILWDDAEKLQYEFYTNRDNRTRKKIEQWYKIFEWDPKYSHFFADHLQHILNKKWYVWNDKDRHKFAAAFLFMIKKEWPYPRCFRDEKDQWKRVENLLGPEHKKRFLNFYENTKHKLEQEKDLAHRPMARLSLQEELNKMEIQYIICAIDWSAPYGSGSDSNEHMLKSIWSQTFMEKLKENIKWYYNCHDEEKQKLDTFFAAEESYLRNMWSAQLHKALAALERMCETAQTPDEAFRVKWYLLWAMLMWVVLHDRSPKVISSFWATCRSMWFTPWYWMRDIEQQDKVKILLDWVTNGKFSTDLKFNVSDFQPGWDYGFVKKFESYWNSHWHDILDKIEDPTYKTSDLDNSIVDLANQNDNPNSFVFKEIVWNSTTNEIDSSNPNVPSIFWQLSPKTATSNMVKSYIPRNWKFSKLKAEEDKCDAEDFWVSALKKIPSWEANKQVVDNLFQKFFNRFDDALETSVQKSIIRSLPLIKQQKETCPENARYMLWYMLKWNMHYVTRWSFPTEFDQVMDRFVDFFYANIDKIDQGTINAQFSDSTLRNAFSDGYVVFEWWPFYDRYMNWQQKEKTKYKNNAKVTLKQIGKEETDVINYKIETIRSNTKEYCTPKIKFDKKTWWWMIPVGTLENNECNKRLEEHGWEA